jgi:phage-related protein
MNPEFTETKNLQVNSPVWLFHVECADASGESDLFLTTGDADIQYFRFDDAGNSYPQVYEAWPELSHDGLQFASNLEIQRPEVTLSNVSREIQAFLQSKNFLRGRVVRVIRTFRNLLNNAQACDIRRYKINSHSANANVVKFTLAGELDIMNRVLPSRYFYRKCGNGVVYKGRRCWISNGDGTYSMPPGFSIDRYFFWQPTVNTTSMPLSNTNQLLQLIIHPLNMPTLNKNTDSIRFDLRVNLIGVPNNNTSWHNWPITFYFGNGIAFNDVGIATYSTNLSAVLQSINVVNNVTLPFADFTTFAPIDVSSIRYFGVRIQRLNNPIGMTSWNFEVGNTEFLMQNPNPQGDGNPDTCGRTLFECRRHNNVARFGGFPSIPNKAL